MKSQRSAIAIRPDAVIRAYGRAETAHWMEQWLDAFGRECGDVCVDPYAWHVFSFGCHPSVALDAARAEYREAVAALYVVVDGDRGHAVETDERPSLREKGEYLVFPSNFAWTMAFTHEDGWLGPFFARHRDYDRLHEDNLAAIRNRHAAEPMRSNDRS